MSLLALFNHGKVTYVQNFDLLFSPIMKVMSKVARLCSINGRASDLSPLYPAEWRFESTVRQVPMLVDTSSVMKKTSLKSTSSDNILYYKREMTTLNQQSNKSVYKQRQSPDPADKLAWY